MITDPKLLITDAEILEQLKMACRHVKLMAESGEKEIIPLLTLWTRCKVGEALKPLAMRIAELPSDHEMKHALFRKVGHHASAVVSPDELVVCAVHITEAWMVMAARGVDVTKIRPSMSPKRVECVVVSAMSLDGRCCGMLYELRRRADKSLVLIEQPGMSAPAVSPPNDDSRALRSGLLASLFDGVHDAMK